jgi:hypothetical protein
LPDRSPLKRSADRRHPIEGCERRLSARIDETPGAGGAEADATTSASPHPAPGRPRLCHSDSGNAYAAGLLIDGTPTSRDNSECGTSAPVFHAYSGSTGAGIVSRYRPSHPGPCVDSGFAVDQMSVPSKCERLEFS